MLSDDELDSSESSIEEGRGWDLPENKGLRPVPPLSPSRSSPRRVSPNQHRRSKTSASNLLLKSPKKKAEHRTRARLLSNGNITVSSCNTTDSLHRRSSVAVLPALDKIWRQPALAPAGALGKPFNVPPPPLASVDLVRRPSAIRGRTLSTGSQLTQTSGLTQVTFENGDESYTDDEESETTEEDEEDNTESEHGSDELSFDLSESDLGSESGTKLSTSRAVDVKTSAAVSTTKHVRILSDCSTNLGHGVSAMVATASKTTQGLVQAKELNKVWVGKDSSLSNGKSDAVVEENQVQYHPASYLPGLPIPDAATVTAVASIFTAGWTAVFWESPIDTVSSKVGNEVPNVTLDNLYFIQLLPGGMLQLTPAVNEGTMGKTILVMPKCQTVSGGGGQWSVQLVSRRAGHCLVIAIAASTGSSKQQRELYLLPVHLPPAYRSQMPNNSMQVSTELTKSSNGNNNMSNLLFAPFQDVDSKKKGPSLLFAPNHQHDAALYLRFAMDSALTADALRGQQ